MWGPTDAEWRSTLIILAIIVAVVAVCGWEAAGLIFRHLSWS